MIPAIFLDRDGVIIENKASYVRAWEDVDLFPQALTAISMLSNHSYPIVIVTNQSVVGRKLISETEAWAINWRLLSKIEEAGGRVERVFMCPHAPWDDCPCRKPKPGMFLQAAKEFSIDMKRSYMIGDAISDLVAARAAGVGNLALVLTGRGRQQLLVPALQEIRPLSIYDSLLDAVTAISQKSSGLAV